MSIRTKRSICIPLIMTLMLLCACNVLQSVAGDQTAQDIKGSTPKGIMRRYAYVVEVETPQGVVTGRSVNGVRFDCHQSLNGKTCDTSEVSEAAAVDLPDGRTLYALLTQHGEPEFICCMHPGAIKDGGTWAYSEFLPDHYPDLTTFDNNNDRRSVHIVDGTKLFDNGYKIKRIYKASTNDPITNEILHRLPWLNGYFGALDQNPATMDHTDAGKILSISFINR